jgi:hypothetical protein
LDREPATSPDTEAALRVTSSGNARELGGETPLGLAKGHLRRSAPAPLERLLRIEPAAERNGFSISSRAAWSRIDIEAAEVRPAGVWLPAWLFLPRAADPAKPAILALDPSGRNARGREGGLYSELAARGWPVCAADVRGVGDLTPEYGRGSPSYARDHAGEEAYGWASLILGRPLAGQRAADILALVSALREHPAARGRRLRLCAAGRLAVPALFAAALDGRIDELYLSAPLVSYRSILETEEYSVPFSNFVPSILRHKDLPEIAASITPRPVLMAGVVDAKGDRMDPDEVHRIYRAAGNVTIRPEALWDEASLSGVW